MSRKAVVSGGSSGGFLTQVSATISSVPKCTGRPIGAAKVETRAVTLSSPCSTASAASARAPVASAATSATPSAPPRRARSVRGLGTARRLLLVAEREHELAEQLHQVDRRLAV